MSDDSMLTVTPGERIDVWTEHRLIRKDELADIRQQLATATADRAALVEQLATVQAERDEAIKQRDMAIGQREESLYHWGADACSVRVREADLARWRGEATVLREALTSVRHTIEVAVDGLTVCMESAILNQSLTVIGQALAATPLAAASAAVVEAAQRYVEGAKANADGLRNWNDLKSAVERLATLEKTNA